MSFEQLAWGYKIVEGPRTDADNNLYFSDVWGGGVYRRSPDGEITTILPRDYLHVGGIALHADGGIVISGPDIRHLRDGEHRVLFELDGIVSFNDLYTDAQGRVLVGCVRSNLRNPPSPWEPGEMYRISGPGEVEELYRDVMLTNGIGFSPDGAVLYHSDSVARHIIAHDVDADGNLSNRRAFGEIDRGYPDGLAVDAEGNVWVASFDGGCVLRFAPDGAPLDPLEVPAEQVTSVAFGGPDLRDLYVVTRNNTAHPDRRGTIFRTRADVPGLPAPLATV